MKITKEKMIQLTAGWIPGILTVFFFIKIQSIHNQMTSEEAAAGIGVFLFIIWGLVHLKTKNRKYVIYRAALLILCFGIVSVCQWDFVFIKAFLLSLILNGMIWKVLDNIRKERRRILPRTVLCIGILAMIISCNCYLLYGRSSQDYKSVYEIGSTESPDREYTARSFMYENAGDSYTVFVRLTDKKSGREKNIYQEEQKDLDVRMKWMSNGIIQINGRRIRI